ncbi:MAG: SDR family oxidoreductase [Candidatus Solibacter usitatus]|nr:SDR family oxidoreductase [Candidatus Solibacter usitatus]
MLHNKVAIITGAAAGIGEATALLFAERRAKVVVLDRDAAGAAQSVQRISAAGGEALACAADMRDHASLAAAVAAAIARFGRIDALINNAGIYPRKPFLEVTEAEWDQMHDINLKGLFRITQLALPHMLAAGGGKIVNISSVTFFLGPPLMSHYVASKGGVVGLTRALAKEFGERNIHVNCITPGAIQTESEKHFVSAEQERDFLNGQCLKRRLQPIDVARVCAFLAGPESDGMTGQTLNVDAGWVLY